MTTRDLASVAIKILGVYFACEGIGILAVTTSAIFFQELKGMLSPPEILSMTLMTCLPVLLVGWACIYFGDGIGAYLCRSSSEVSLGMGRADLLTVGFAVVGVAIAVSHIQDFLVYGATAAWNYVSKTEMTIMPVVNAHWPQLVKPGVATLVGAILASRSRKLALYLEKRFAPTGAVGSPPAI
jgi:hypothetical protein